MLLIAAYNLLTLIQTQEEEADRRQDKWSVARFLQYFSDHLLPITDVLPCSLLVTIKLKKIQIKVSIIMSSLKWQHPFLID